jgi:hypothetical protein
MTGGAEVRLNVFDGPAIPVEERLADAKSWSS